MFVVSRLGFRAKGKLKTEIPVYRGPGFQPTYFVWGGR